MKGFCLISSSQRLIRVNFLHIFSLLPSLPISVFHPQHTIVSILVDVPQGRYGCAKTSEDVCAGEGNRTGECERCNLQVQVNPPHLPGLALHLSLHVEGCSNQHIVHPGDTKCSFVPQVKTRQVHVSRVTSCFFYLPISIQVSDSHRVAKIGGHLRDRRERKMTINHKSNAVT